MPQIWIKSTTELCPSSLPALRGSLRWQNHVIVDIICLEVDVKLTRVLREAKYSQQYSVHPE